MKGCVCAPIAEKYTILINTPRNIVIVGGHFTIVEAKQILKQRDISLNESVSCYHGYGKKVKNIQLYYPEKEAKAGWLLNCCLDTPCYYDDKAMIVEM